MPRHRVSAPAPVSLHRPARSALAAAPLALVLALSACGDPGSSSSTGGSTTTTTTTSSAGGGGTGGMTTTSGGGGTGGTGTSGGGTGGIGATGGGGTGGQSLCGNGMLDAGEPCEGANLQGATCESLGYPGGSLKCSVTCQYDVGDCAGADNCYDGIDNDGDGKTDCDEADCASICASACFSPAQVADPDDPSGSTVGHSDSLAASCVAASGPDVAFAFTASQTGILDLTLTETSGAPLALSVRAACDNGPAEIACSSAYVAGSIDQKALSIPVTQGQQLFVVVDGDGASSEGSFALFAQTRPIQCGDGYEDPPEGCDDANTINGDGCSAACAVESTETEPNGTLATADSFLAPWYASIAPAGDVDYVQINWPSQAGMAVMTEGIGFGKCTDGSMDTVVTIYTAGGTALVTNDDHGGTCSLTSLPNLAAGTYYARIEAPPGAPPAAATFPYLLFVTPFVCGNGAVQTGEECDDGNTAPGDGCDGSCKVEVDETEPNNTLAQADTWSAPWVARIDPDGDVDVVAVTVAAPATKITASTSDPSGGNGCQSQIDTYVEIVKSGDLVIASNDDAGGGYCSIAVAGNLPPDTYYVRVKAPPALDSLGVYIYSYKLNIKVE